VVNNESHPSHEYSCHSWLSSSTSPRSNSGSLESSAGLCVPPSPRALILRSGGSRVSRFQEPGLSTDCTDFTDSRKINRRKSAKSADQMMPCHPSRSHRTFVSLRALRGFQDSLRQRITPITRIFVPLLVQILFSCANSRSAGMQVLETQTFGSHTEPQSHRGGKPFPQRSL